MKNILFWGFILITTLPIFGAVTYLYLRYENNPSQELPLPYTMNYKADQIEASAPILIVGDKMASQLALYKETLIETVSKNLKEPITLQVISKSDYPLHRLVHDLKELKKWPKVMIVAIGASELLEKLYDHTEIGTIKKNLELYKIT